MATRAGNPLRAALAAGAGPRSPLVGLPDDPLRLILEHLEAPDVCHVGSTCQRLACAAGDPLVWTSLYSRDWDASSAETVREVAAAPKHVYKSRVVTRTEAVQMKLVDRRMRIFRAEVEADEKLWTTGVGCVHLLAWMCCPVTAMLATLALVVSKLDALPQLVEVAQGGEGNVTANIVPLATAPRTDGGNSSAGGNSSSGPVYEWTAPGEAAAWPWHLVFTPLWVLAGLATLSTVLALVLHCYKRGGCCECFEPPSCCGLCKRPSRRRAELEDLLRVPRLARAGVGRQLMREMDPWGRDAFHEHSGVPPVMCADKVGGLGAVLHACFLALCVLLLPITVVLKLEGVGGEEYTWPLAFLPFFVFMGCAGMGCCRRGPLRCLRWDLLHNSDDKMLCAGVCAGVLCPALVTVILLCTSLENGWYIPLHKVLIPLWVVFGAVALAGSVAVLFLCVKMCCGRRERCDAFFGIVLAFACASFVLGPLILTPVFVTCKVDGGCAEGIMALSWAKAVSPVFTIFGIAGLATLVLGCCEGSKDLVCRPWRAYRRAREQAQSPDVSKVRTSLNPFAGYDPPPQLGAVNGQRDAFVRSTSSSRSMRERLDGVLSVV